MEVNEMKIQILLALLVLAMMMGTGTVMAKDLTASDDGEYLGEEFGWGPSCQMKGEYAPFLGVYPNGINFGCRNGLDDVAEIEV
jgi:hypothetical protein